MSTFPADFRRIVVPRLRRMARFEGLRVACGLNRFEAAHRALVAEAYRLGAGHLPDDIRDEVPDTVADWLLAAVDAALPAWEAAEARAARVAEQIARHEHRLSWEAPDA